MKASMETTLEEHGVTVKQILQKVRGNHHSSNMPWSLNSIQTFSQRNNLNFLVKSIPEFLDDIKKLLRVCQNKTDDGFKSILDLLCVNEVSKIREWEESTNKLCVYLEGSFSEKGGKSLAQLYGEKKERGRRVIEVHWRT
jgi:hypothetical protein